MGVFGGGCISGSLLVLHGQFQVGGRMGCFVCVFIFFFFVFCFFFFFLFGFSRQEAWVPQNSASSLDAALSAL